MPLDDREQRILAEIERQFYEEDPALAHAVRNIDHSGRFGVKLPLLGVIVGIVAVLVTFTVSPFLALAGFAVLVVSATALVHGIRTRGGLGGGSGGEALADRIRRIRRFRRG